MARILLVEDDTTLSRLYGSILDQEGHEVLLSHQGADALNQLDSFRPDLVICDIQMPIMDGWTLLKQVRLSEQWRQLPFIFMTGLDSEADQRLGRELGADDYLTKPVSYPELVEAIRLRLGKQESLQALHASRSQLLLHLAAANGDLDELKRLLAQTQEIDLEDEQGNTPLMFAVMMRQEEVARFLQRQGANPDLRHPATGMRIGAMARAMHLDI